MCIRDRGSIGRFFRITALKRLSPGRSFIFRIHGAVKAFASSVVNGREVGGGIVRCGEMAFGGKQAISPQRPIPPPTSLPFTPELANALTAP